jgi:hypothetical protein
MGVSASSVVLIDYFSSVHRLQVVNTQIKKVKKKKIGTPKINVN